MTQETGENIAGRLCDWDRQGEKPVPLMQEAAAYIRHRIAAETASAARVAECLEWLRKHIAEVDDDNSYWGGPHKREYLSAPEILKHLQALAHTTPDAGEKP